jgi:hypothetical protein
MLLDVGQDLTIGWKMINDQQDLGSMLVRRHQLTFTLSRLAEDAETEPGARLFRLMARDHPSVIVYAEEYPNTVTQ